MKRAVILAAAWAPRLRPYTTVLPKPLMPVGDRPVLDIVVRQLHRDGFDPHHDRHRLPRRAHRGVLPQRREVRLPIDYFREEEPLGTVGAHRAARRHGRGLPRHERRRPHGHQLQGAAGAPRLHRRRGDHRDAREGGADLARRPRLRGSGRRHATHELLREAEDRLRGVDGRLLRLPSPEVIEHIEAGKRLDFPDLILRSSPPASRCGRGAVPTSGSTSGAPTTTKRPRRRSSACATA